MASMRIFVLLYVSVVCSHIVASGKSTNVFDQDLYESVLDSEQCERQLTFLANHSLRFQFLDASAKLPSGILKGNLNDLGDFYQCLSIDQMINDMDIKGKYCTVIVHIEQEPIVWPDLPEFTKLPDLDITLPNKTLPNVIRPRTESDQTLKRWEVYSRLQRWELMMSGHYPAENHTGESINTEQIFPLALLAMHGMKLAVCVPRVCTVKQAIEFSQRYTFLNMKYKEYFCRLPDDKPYVAADYVAIVVFSMLGILTVTSTLYDVSHNFVKKRDPSKANPFYCCFSVYTNTRRLLTFNTIPGALECIDGIRALSMIWVILGHSYSLTLLVYVHNITDIVNWLQGISSIWLNSAPIVVDTFFLLSGILCVYTVVGKMTRSRFIRSLHLFYLNRLLRMFPLLATLVLLQCSVFHRLSDGPVWINVANATNHCRIWWWAALLHVQNYVNPLEMCLVHTWYLSVDMQLYMVCPLILFLLFCSKSYAWTALTISVLLALLSASLYSYLYNFSAALGNFARIGQYKDYFQMYYLNTLARAAPFFIGMAFGYLLHLLRAKKVRIPKLQVTLLWAMALLMMLFCIVSMYPVMQPDHTAQALDNFLNANMRSFWALGLGWLILACVHGYGGPINWFLSLGVWKLPARMSYAIYLVHVPLMMVANSSLVKTYYFTQGDSLYRFASDLLLAFVAAFILCITIDAPFSTLLKLIIGGGGSRRQPKKEPEEYSQSAHNVATNNETYLKTTL